MEAVATEAAAVVVEEAAAVDVVAVVEPLPPTQVILRFFHGAEHRADAFATV